MTNSEKDKIIRRFWEIIPEPICPMCKGREFSVLDSYLVNPVIDDYRKPQALMRRSVPTVSIVCTKCGFISQHSMGVMGLLDGRSTSETSKDGDSISTYTNNKE